jgi:hypothetical protein
MWGSGPERSANFAVSRSGCAVGKEPRFWSAGYCCLIVPLLEDSVRRVGGYRRYLKSQGLQSIATELRTQETALSRL